MPVVAELTQPPHLSPAMALPRRGAGRWQQVGAAMAAWGVIAVVPRMFALVGASMAVPGLGAALTLLPPLREGRGTHPGHRRATSGANAQGRPVCACGG